MLKGKGESGFGYSSTAEQVTDGLELSGKRYLVTGVNSGLGAEALRVLVARGAEVVGTARDINKAEHACGALGSRAKPAVCELSEPESVRACVDKLMAADQPLDGIIANAGVMAIPTLTVKHGLELQFLTNHIGHFLLITRLLPLLTASGRVVVLSSEAHRMAPQEGIEFDNLDGSRGYSPWKAYGQSKLANLLFARELARRLPSSQQTANAVHPGVISTGLWRSMHGALAGLIKLVSPLALKSVPEGAATGVFALTHPSVADINGEYFVDCNRASGSAHSEDAALSQRLWKKSEELVTRLEK